MMKGRTEGLEYLYFEIDSGIGASVIFFSPYLEIWLKNGNRLVSCKESYFRWVIAPPTVCNNRKHFPETSDCCRSRLASWNSVTIRSLKHAYSTRLLPRRTRWAVFFFYSTRCDGTISYRVFPKLYDEARSGQVGRDRASSSISGKRGFAS